MMGQSDVRGKLRLRFGARSVMVPLFGSFIAILLIALVTGGVLYWKARAIVERTVSSTNAAMLEQIREVADGRLKELEQLEQQVAFHPKLLWLLGAKGTMTDEDAFRSVELVNDLQRYKSLSKLVYDFYIYVRATGTLVGPNVKTTAPILFDSVYRFPGKTSADWNAVLQQGGYRQYEPAATIGLDNGSGKRVITYVQSIPYLGGAAASGTLLVLIDEDQLRNLLAGLAAASRGQMYILDDRNRIISSIGTTADANSQPSNLRYEALAGDAGKLEQTWDGKKMIVSYASSGVNGWKYVFAMPRDVFLDEVNDVRRWAVMLLLICAVGGGAASAYLAYRNYRPIRAVLRDILRSGGAAGDGAASGSEYELIRSAIETSRRSESQLRGMLAQQAPIIRVYFLTRLIRGNADVSELQPDALRLVGVEFVSDSFAVMLIDVGDLSGIAPDKAEREWPFVSFIIGNIATELANKHHRGFSVELERGRVALLINVREERSGQAVGDIKAITDTLGHVLESRFHLNPAIGASTAAHELGGIGEAFREALLALDQRLADSRGGANSAAVESVAEGGLPEPFFYYPLEVEQQFINLIKAGEAAKAEKLLDSIYEENYMARRISPELQRILLPSIAGTLLKLAQQAPELGRTLAQRLASAPPEGEDAAAAFANLRDSLRVACAHFQNGRSDQSERMLNNIRKHVRERFGDNMLSVNSIADQFGITPSYLSAFFKKASGQNVADFIAQIRIAEAKRMLAEPQLTIAQIATKVGYANDIGFIRFFKKYEGVTPGAYRQSIESVRAE
ncbi:AraC family transcriptional regulator [Paenibacillus whitsoniae]|nr:helix-turn-helix domain-containing protein [Paenibacillus whitsoniae]